MSKKYYENKYLKYKQKYFELKQYGGFNCNVENLFYNNLGSCWNNAIQTMLMCSHYTKQLFEDNFEKKIGINSKDNFEYYDSIKDNLFDILYKDSKIKLPFDITHKKTHINIYLKNLAERILVRRKPEFNRTKTVEYERTNTTSAKNLCFRNPLLKYKDKMLGGNHYNHYILVLCNALFTINKSIKITNYLFDINKDDIKANINTLNKYIGITLFLTDSNDGHLITIFSCDGESYALYDNGIKYDLGEIDDTITKLNEYLYNNKIDNFEDFKIKSICFYELSDNYNIYNDRKYIFNNLLFIESLYKNQNITKVFDNMEKYRNSIRMKKIDFYNVTNPYMINMTILHYYCDEKTNIYYSLIQKLIKNGANVHAIDITKQTPLFYAVNNKDVTKLLIENRANVNAIDINKQTPLFYAVKNVTKLLIENRANVNAIDINKQTPLFYAVKNNNKDVIELLIDRDANVNAIDKDTQTPLFFAIKNDINKNIIELLIARGANVNITINKTNDEIPTLLFYAIKYNKNKDIIELLIKNRANVNAIDIDKRTPLHYAIIANSFFNNKNEDIIELLIKNKADVNAKDENGDNLLDYAKLSGNKDIINLLNNNGAIQ